MIMLPGIKQFDLSGRTVLVTGGSKGLGKAMADGFASAGANLFLVSRNLDEATAAAKEIKGYYPIEAFGYEADVTNEEAVSQMVNEALGRFGQIDVLVNNAGINRRGPIEGCPTMISKPCRKSTPTESGFAPGRASPHEAARQRPNHQPIERPWVWSAVFRPLHGKQGRCDSDDAGFSPELAGTGITVNAICRFFSPP